MASSNPKGGGASLALCVFHLARLISIGLGLLGLVISVLGSRVAVTIPEDEAPLQQRQQSRQEPQHAPPPATIAATKNGDSGGPSSPPKVDAVPTSQAAISPAIPHIIYFTYESNILQTKEPPQFYDNILNTTQKYIQGWKDPNAKIVFLDDAGCRRVIAKAEPRLLDHFDNERKGAYKGDICRIAALVDTGGYYFDIDIKVIEPLLLGDDIAFSSVREDLNKRKKAFNFFQAFLASAPNHPVLRETIRVTLDYYEGRHTLHGFMGVSTMGDGYKAALAAYPDEMKKVRILQELKNVPGVEGYYEDLPQQKGGIGCCCQHVVHDPEERRVYFRSRIVGAGQFCMDATQYEEHSGVRRKGQIKATLASPQQKKTKKNLLIHTRINKV
jgi:mannosyltransferase OCH1-like enzyme